MEVSYKNGKFQVIYKGQLVIDQEESLHGIGLEVGIGQDKYVMKRGAFRIKDKVSRIFYQLIHVDDRKDQILVTYQWMNHKIYMTMMESDGYLELNFTYTDKRINRLYLNLCTSKDEMAYGCGEQFAAFNLKGKKVKNWVSEHVALSSILKKIVAYQLNKKVGLMAYEKYASYMVQPTFITNHKRFVHVDCSAYSQFDFKDTQIEIEVREPVKRIYIGQDDDYPSLMSRLTHLIGRQPRLPEWVFDGMILGIQDGPQVCQEKLDKMLGHGGKINGIWAQDWEGQRITKFGKQLFWNWKYDKSLYKDLPDYIKKWQEDQVNFLGYINPFLAMEGDLYKEASQKGYLVKNKHGQDYLVTITTFPAAMIDLTNPVAFEYMKNIITDHMLGIGMKGWMADFAEYLPTDAVLYSGQDPRLVHNRWPVLWARCNQEAIEEAGLEDQIFFFVRAGFTGTGTHAKMMWNGDQHVDWTRDYGIGSIVNSQLSLAVSGIGNSHSDIGGYTTFGKMTRSKELLLRWTEMNAFSMVMRSHEGNQPDKNHQFDSDEETMAFISRFTRIYSHLKPYHLHLDQINHSIGMPSIRPLFFHYQGQGFEICDDAYLLGQDLVVYPVVEEGQESKELILPEDEWIHIMTGQEYIGGRITLSVPLGRPPVFYRKNSEFRELFERVKDM